MTKQQKTALNMAKFIQNQSLLLLEKLNREARRPRRSRFSIGSAPLTSITKSDAQISGGETRQDYKDTRRFPLAAPSCALLFLPFGLPVSFRCYGRVYFIPRLTLSSG